MQTFLPYPNFVLTARCLDNRRLNKQITETGQIVTAIVEIQRGVLGGWHNHPAVKMWNGFSGALCWYGHFLHEEWKQRFYDGKRGGKPYHLVGMILSTLAAHEYTSLIEFPAWHGQDRFHSAHRSILLAKNPEWYSQFGWSEEPAEMVNGRWPYWWPEG